MNYRFDLSSFPLRSEASHLTEMVSEILLGELFSVLDEFEDWKLIQLLHDGYTGWIERKDSLIIHQADSTHVVIRPCWRNGQFLNPGCLIDSLAAEKLPIGSSKPKSAPLQISEILELAKQYINVPYLWGGRTLHGIDCSGFVQVVARFAHLQLPRDAYQQATFGQEVGLSQAQPMDLAFFNDPGKKITHVGFVLSDNQILHSSEKVRIDRLDERGIYRESLQSYTHSLSHVRRIL